MEFLDNLQSKLRSLARPWVARNHGVGWCVRGFPHKEIRHLDEWPYMDLLEMHVFCLVARIVHRDNCRSVYSLFLDEPYRTDTLDSDTLPHFNHHYNVLN
jgi:hypothetical protein